PRDRARRRCREAARLPHGGRRQGHPHALPGGRDRHRQRRRPAARGHQGLAQERRQGTGAVGGRGAAGPDAYPAAQGRRRRDGPAPEIHQLRTGTPMRPAASLAATLFMLAALLVPASSGALESATTQYRVGYNGLSARGSMSLRPSGNRWVVTLKVGNAVASIDQSTVFDVNGGRLRPLGSSRRVDTAISGKAITTTFDWRAGSARWKGDVKPSRAGPVALQAGDIDMLLLNVALARDVAAGRATRYRVVDNGHARMLAFKRLGTETVTVDGRKREAVKLFAAADGRQYVAWIVPGMALLARFLQHEPDGDTIDMRAA